MIVAVIALVSSLTGGAIAATVINGKNIKKNTVTSKQVRNNSLTGADIKNGSVAKADLAGDAFAAGPKGDKGDTGASALTATIPSGTTVVGDWAVSTESLSGAGRTTRTTFDLPGRAPVALTSTDVNFNTGGSANTSDADATCTGSASNPSAPPGKLCIYRDSGVVSGDLIDQTGSVYGSDDRTFMIRIQIAAGTTYDTFGRYAYTAP